MLAHISNAPSSRGRASGRRVEAEIEPRYIDAIHFARTAACDSVFDRAAFVPCTAFSMTEENGGQAFFVRRSVEWNGANPGHRLFQVEKTDVVRPHLSPRWMKERFLDSVVATRNASDCASSRRTPRNVGSSENPAGRDQGSGTCLKLPSVIPVLTAALSWRLPE